VRGGKKKISAFRHRSLALAQILSIKCQNRDANFRFDVAGASM
jgi:hypothetical protein